MLSVFAKNADGLGLVDLHQAGSIDSVMSGMYLPSEHELSNRT